MDFRYRFETAEPSLPTATRNSIVFENGDEEDEIFQAVQVLDENVNNSFDESKNTQIYKPLQDSGGVHTYRNREDFVNFEDEDNINFATTGQDRDTQNTVTVMRGGKKQKQFNEYEYQRDYIKLSNTRIFDNTTLTNIGSKPHVSRGVRSGGNGSAAASLRTDAAQQDQHGDCQEKCDAGDDQEAAAETVPDHFTLPTTITNGSSTQTQTQFQFRFSTTDDVSPITGPTNVVPEPAPARTERGVEGSFCGDIDSGVPFFDSGAEVLDSSVETTQACADADPPMETAIAEDMQHDDDASQGTMENASEAMDNSKKAAKVEEDNGGESIADRVRRRRGSTTRRWR